MDMEDYSPRLRRQRSCACPPLDVGTWCGSRRSNAGFARMLADEELGPFTRRPSRSAGTRLLGLWRRMMKEKRKIVDPVAPVAYDPYTYAQNFDEGSAWAEPENLSRSFSARFAVPAARVLQRFG